MYHARPAGEMAERSKALDWNSSNILTGVRGFESHSLRHTDASPAKPLQPSMVARTGFSATTSRKSRQARKGAAVAVMSGAGAELVRATSMVGGARGAGRRSG